MPNWCSNSITIEGPKDKILALWAQAKTNGSGLLAAMVPMPTALRDTVKGTGDELQTEQHDGFTNRYDWSESRWGTKWDISLEGLDVIANEQGRARITGWADSAWGPPQDAFQTYANANEDCYLELKYFEPGMSFIGVWDSEGGDAYWDDLHTLLDTSPEEDPVLYELLDQFNVWEWYEVDEDE